MAEPIRMHREAIRTGWLLFSASNPLKIQLAVLAPRVILQSIFIALAGRVLGGRPGAEYALTGSAAYAACTWTIVYIGDVPINDKLSASYYRLQAGALAPYAVYLCRTLPFLVSGAVSSLLVIAVAGPIVGLGHLSLSLLALMPFFVLMAATSAAFGLAVAGLAVPGERDTLFGNLATYLILATAGIIAPYPASARWITDVGSLLPVEHGLAAVRAGLAGQAWGGQALLEAAVGLGWALLAVLVLAVEDRRVRSGSPARRRHRRQARAG